MRPPFKLAVVQQDVARSRTPGKAAAGSHAIALGGDADDLFAAHYRQAASAVGIAAASAAAENAGGQWRAAWEELADPKPLRSDAIDGRDGPVEDVIQPLELAGPLEGEDVERLFDHAESTAVAPGVAADRARRGVGQIEALVAEHDLLLDPRDRVGELLDLGVGRREHVEGEARRGLLADAGQAAQCRDQALDRRGGAH